MKGYNPATGNIEEFVPETNDVRITPSGVEVTKFNKDLVKKELNKKKSAPKPKPRITHIGFQCDFNQNPRDLSLESDRPAFPPKLSSMDISFECKLENVPMDGAVKYQIMQDIKDAVEKVKEKWS